MEPKPGFADEGSPDPVPGGVPFGGPGLLARVGPFALVAVAAEASLALPPGTQAWPAVDEALPPEAADRLLGLLSTALGQLGMPAGPTLVCVEAAERLSVTVTTTGPSPQSAIGDVSSRDFTPLHARARQDGIAIEIESAADGIRLARSLPLRP
jgi:hypothetical protein